MTNNIIPVIFSAFIILFLLYKLFTVIFEIESQSSDSLASRIIRKISPKKYENLKADTEKIIEDKKEKYDDGGEASEDEIEKLKEELAEKMNSVKRNLDEYSSRKNTEK